MVILLDFYLRENSSELEKVQVEWGNAKAEPADVPGKDEIRTRQFPLNRNDHKSALSAVVSIAAR